MFPIAFEDLSIVYKVLIFLAGLGIAWLAAKWLIRYAMRLVTFMLTVAIAAGIFYALYYFFLK